MYRLSHGRKVPEKSGVFRAMLKVKKVETGQQNAEIKLTGMKKEHKPIKQYGCRDFR